MADGRSETQARLDLSNLHDRIEEYGRLERRYHNYWPATDLLAPVEPGNPGNILDDALQKLHDWESRADPLIQQLEAISSETADLKMLGALLQLPERDVPDYLDADHSKMTVTFTRTPSLGDIPYPVMMEPNLVIEYYAQN